MCIRDSQNGLLGVSAAQAEGAVDLAQLAQRTLHAAGALVAGQVLDELLFQRRGCLLYTSRQTGSTIKPIGAYALGIEYGLVNWSTMLNNSPLYLKQDMVCLLYTSRPW